MVFLSNSWDSVSSVCFSRHVIVARGAEKVTRACSWCYKYPVFVCVHGRVCRAAVKVHFFTAGPLQSADTHTPFRFQGASLQTWLYPGPVTWVVIQTVYFGV